MSDSEDGDEEMKCLLDGLEEYCAEEVTKVTVEVKEAHGEIKQLTSGLTKACDDVKTVDGKVCFMETAQEQRNVRTEEQLANFMTDIKVMKDGMVKVEQRLYKIESNIENTCKDFIAKTFTAAATAARGQKLTDVSLPQHIVSTATTGSIDHAVDCSTDHGDTHIIDVDVSLPRIQPIAEFQPTLMAYADNRWSRKTSTPNTSQIYTDIDELPDEERKELSPFHDRNPMAAAGRGDKRSPVAIDNFYVRRSDRMTTSQIQKEEAAKLEHHILNGTEDGLEVQVISEKGRGVFSTKAFNRGDFVVEYVGDVISGKEARARELEYANNPDTGCYMYHFSFKNKSYCIDATEESGKLGRLLNHSKNSGNCRTKLVEFKNKPYLIFVASRDITEGEELVYDYGDRRKSAIDSHPWINN